MANDEAVLVAVCFADRDVKNSPRSAYYELTIAAANWPAYGFRPAQYKYFVL